MKLQPVPRGITVVASVSVMLTLKREISFHQWKFQWRSTELKENVIGFCDLLFVSIIGCSSVLTIARRIVYLHLEYNYFRIKPGQLELNSQLFDKQSWESSSISQPF